MKEKFIKLYIDWAERVAQLSYAKRLNVGAVIVKDDSVISYGYNGMPAGWDNNCEHIELQDFDAGGWLSPEEIIEKWPFEGKFWVNGQEIETRYRLKTKPEVLHAERNALDKLAKRGGIGGKDSSIFITHSPCLECAKSIYGAGIKEVFYKRQYRSSDGINFLQQCGIEVSKVD